RVRRASGSSSTITTRTSFVIGILELRARNHERNLEAARVRRDRQRRLLAVNRVEAFAQRVQSKVRAVLRGQSVAAVIAHLHQEQLVDRVGSDLDPAALRT